MATPPASAAATVANAVAKTATVFTTSTTGFTPRTTFEVSSSVTRSYFLGHHNAALAKMRQTISNVGLIIECRDFRIPVTSWNPLLERTLAERPRIIVYTHRDLGPPKPQATRIMSTLRDFHLPSSSSNTTNTNTKAVLFLSNEPQTHTPLLATIKSLAREHDSLTGLRALVVGMPNAGKSTLLNRLRARGMNLPKAAKTGAQPGVTRKFGTPVRIAPGESTLLPGSEGLGEGVFIVDTPGVFIPYVAKPEDMLKMALVGCVKDGLVPAMTVADYLLYHLNRVDPGIYQDKFCKGEATNDVHEFLKGVALRTGKLRKGGEVSLEGAAEWVVQEWRRGGLGKFVLDEVSEGTLREAVRAAEEPALSMNQARKKEKEGRKVRNEMKRLGISPSAEG
ncbi:P-loop containing nucleoside triphosphate hydrolase protein [Immersiella caudata]|uniref:P-loop containing nucleoside triphosphate hydrolase protein n=1 Tax=Immersiella caudata TaxID=314043 RepID=A0AA39XFX4_9PEZI|nr:P-loop containing nucleoside triphosphate hydrolase protein [Immersiella caudata]